MITKSNLKNMLKSVGFSDTSKDKYEKNYPISDCSIIVDFRNEKIIYPEDKGFKVNVATTTNFSEPENFVVLECVNRLLDKGYRPENIELERTWTLGHEQKSGRADICVSNQNGKMLFIVECKTFGVEYNKEMKNILSDGGQLISYWQQERGCRWLVLYASNINSSNDIEYTTDSIDCSDDENILNLARKDATILLYKDAHTASELYDAWKETYEQRFSGDIIFRDDSVAYDIGVKPLRKKDLKDFSENDKIVNRFEEILRHNNVSDKENAFNRLIIRRIISSFFAWLEDENYIVKSPARRIHKIRVGKTVKDVYSDEELEQMRDTCTNLRDLAIIDVLSSTGIRVGELVNLNIADVDFEKRECVVMGKGNKQRKVYFDARTKIHLYEYIASRHDETKALFVSLNNPHNRLSIRGIETILHKVGSNLKSTKVHPHKFRRTLATKAIDKGMPIEQVQVLLGHSQIDTTLRYAMVNQNNVKASHHKYIG